MTVTAILFATMLIALPVHATVIYDNGAPNQMSAYASNSLYSEQTADDFSLSAGANIITEIQWWGSYSLYSGPFEFDDFTISIYNDMDNSPGDVVWSEHVNHVNRELTDLDWKYRGVVAYDIYAYSVEVDNIELQPDTPYHLSIEATPQDLYSFWFWASSSMNGSHSWRMPRPEIWVGGWWAPGQLAFNLSTDPVHNPAPLNAEPVPEPATILLLSIGLVGAYGMRRRLIKQAPLSCRQ